MRPGKIITHPSTGEAIATGGELLGKAKVRSVLNNTAVLRTDRKAGKAVEVGFPVVEDT